MGELARGFVNDNYSKFTHQSSSLIIGLSRAHNGISPKILDSILAEIPYQGGFLNFAFEKTQSPYGGVYLEAIKKKIPEQTKQGIFILSVSPGSFMRPIHLTSAQEIDNLDKNRWLGKLSNSIKIPTMNISGK